MIKSKRKGFPVGKTVNAIKWTLPLSEANKEALMPITFSSWVDDEETGRFKVSVEAGGSHLFPRYSVVC